MTAPYVPLVGWMEGVLDECPTLGRGFDGESLAMLIAEQLRKRPGATIRIIECNNKAVAARLARRLRDLGMAAAVRGLAIVAGFDCEAPVLHRPWRRTLSSEAVVAMREAHSRGEETIGELARRHQITLASAQDILNGYTYRDVGGPVGEDWVRRSARIASVIAAREANREPSQTLDEATLAKLEKYDMAVALGLIED